MVIIMQNPTHLLLLHQKERSHVGIFLLHFPHLDIILFHQTAQKLVKGLDLSSITIIEFLVLVTFVAGLEVHKLRLALLVI